MKSRCTGVKMLSRLSIAQQIAFWLCVACVSIVAFYSAYGTYARIALHNRTVSEKLVRASAHVEQKIASLAEQAEMLALTFAGDSTLLTLWKERRRDALQSIMGPLLMRLGETSNVGQIVFQEQPTQPFLRVHMPEKFGDDLSKTRPDLHQALKDKTALKGVSVGRFGGFGIRAMVPAELEGENIGVIDIGLKVSDDLLVELQDSITQDLGASISIASMEDGKTQTMVGEAIELFPEQRIMLQSGEIVRRKTGNAAELLSPIFNPVGTMIGVTAVAIEDISFAKFLLMELARAFIVLSMALGLSLITASILARNIVAPLNRLAFATHEIVSGKDDTPIPHKEGNAEIRKLATALETFRRDVKLRKDMERARDERANALIAMINRFKGDVGTSLAGLEDAGRAIDHVAMTIEEASTNSTQDVEAVAESAQAISESIQDVTLNAQHSRSLVSKSVDEVANAHAVMASLEAGVSEISHIAGVIAGIADQTNLLALNATIEASRAGDQGKGFAVVASEIKALAAKTSHATSDISDRLDKIRGTSGEASRKMQNIVDIIESVDEAATVIVRSVEQQAETTCDIAARTESAASDVRNILANVRAQAHTSTAHGMSCLNDASRRLSDQASLLAQQINGFLTSVRAL